ncbi:hypothetical protein BCR34DRAFT_375786 [Clohesyomyces aquaticus]|uniref:Uncharacterized protein n=1 Tax=Clohesyomyces aquaticus TaxID=1231657 RepID=A0A1Y1ZG25_9PLEO|nr:hypothetical protein BCR34DRAFT_375786 [Clohesyomyces aquaticus]
MIAIPCNAAGMVLLKPKSLDAVLLPESTLLSTSTKRYATPPFHQKFARPGLGSSIESPFSKDASMRPPREFSSNPLAGSDDAHHLRLGPGGPQRPAETHPHGRDGAWEPPGLQPTPLCAATCDDLPTESSQDTKRACVVMLQCLWPLLLLPYAKSSDLAPPRRTNHPDCPNTSQSRGRPPFVETPLLAIVLGGVAARVI